MLTWEEVCAHIWRGPLTGTHYKYKIEDGNIWWCKDGFNTWNRWVNSDANAELHIRDTGYTIIGDNLDYVHSSQEEKICKKIALMEARWKKFQLRKHCG